MKDNFVYIFNYLISQWSLTPQAFKEAIVNAAIAKCGLSVIWWVTRLLVSRFPQNTAISVLSKLLNTRPAKLIVLILDITLLDVFLFFAVVALLDLRAQFSYFSLWTAALFAFLLMYMVIITHRDVQNY